MVEPNVLRSRNKRGKDQAKPSGLFQEKAQSVAKRACWNAPRENQEGSIKSILECSRRRLRAWHQKCAGVESVAPRALSKFPQCRVKSTLECSKRMLGTEHQEGFRITWASQGASIKRRENWERSIKRLQECSQRKLRAQHKSLLELRA